MLRFLGSEINIVNIMKKDGNYIKSNIASGEENIYN